MTVTTKITGLNVGKRTIAAMNKAVKAALQETVSHWHETMMPKHFTLEANSLYGYQKRKGDDEGPRVIRTVTRDDGSTYQSDRQNPAYSWRKRRQKRHNRPLVWSGKSERAAKSMVKLSTRKLTGQETIRASAAMSNLPAYFYKYVKELNQPDKADELTRTSAGERAELEAFYRAALDRQMTGGSSTAGTTTVERFG